MEKIMRFMNWSSRFAVRELILGVIVPWAFLWTVLPYSGISSVDAMLEVLGFVLLFLAVILPFRAAEARAAFEEAFASGGRRIAPWQLRTLTVYSLMLASIALASHGHGAAAAGLAVLTAEDAAFFSWMAVSRDGRPELPVAE